MTTHDPSRRYRRLIERKTDPFTVEGLRQRSVLMKSASVPRPADYLRDAAAPTDAAYTAKTFEEGDRVKAQLDEHFKTRGKDVTFDYQGSVTNDTHIKLFSDIDLLAIIGDFYHIVPPLTVTVPYSGDAVAVSRDRRESAAARLASSFYEADVDVSGTKAICISGGSLARTVDVVTCNLVHTARYEQTGHRKYLGINIFDAVTGARITNYPFLHNALLAERDRATGGRLKVVIRLLKSMRYDEELNLDMSSYDICGLAYRFPDHVFEPDDWNELLLRIAKHLLRTSERADFSDLLVVNETRPIFKDAATATASLNTLSGALIEILQEVMATDRRELRIAP